MTIRCNQMTTGEQQCASTWQLLNLVIFGKLDRLIELVLIAENLTQSNQGLAVASSGNRLRGSTRVAHRQPTDVQASGAGRSNGGQTGTRCGQCQCVLDLLRRSLRQGDALLSLVILPIAGTILSLLVGCPILRCIALDDSWLLRIHLNDSASRLRLRLLENLKLGTDELLKGIGRTRIRNDLTALFASQVNCPHSKDCLCAQAVNLFFHIGDIGASITATSILLRTLGGSVIFRIFGRTSHQHRQTSSNRDACRPTLLSRACRGNDNRFRTVD